MKAWMTLCLCAVLLLAACVPEAAPAAPAQPSPLPAVTPAPLPAATRSPAPTILTETLSPLQVKNMSYYLKSLPDQPVVLENGRAQLSDPAKKLNGLVVMVEPVALGDLNGDRMPDAALVLAANYGGSGTFHELIVVLWQGGRPVQAAAVDLGDRVKENSLVIQDGRILLDYLRHAPADPFCCPSEHALVTYQLKNDTLVLVDQKVLPPGK